MAWIQFKLDSNSHWPEKGTLDFSDLENFNFCYPNDTWAEIPYMQSFICT